MKLVTIEMIAPILVMLALAGLGLSAILWGDDSALAAGTRRDGRAVRSALTPE